MDSEGKIEFNGVVCSNNTADASGGCFHAWGGGIINSGTLMQDNIAESGGAMREYNTEIPCAVCDPIVR